MTKIVLAFCIAGALIDVLLGLAGVPPKPVALWKSAADSVWDACAVAMLLRLKWWEVWFQEWPDGDRNRAR